MKYLILLFIFQFSSADQIFRDKNGFASCFEKNDQIYFLDWDNVIQTQKKQVYFFEIKDYVRFTGHQISGCADQKYIQNIPFEVLRPLDVSNNIFSDKVLFSARQINEGGHVFRPEKTAADFINQKLNLFQQHSPSQIESLRKNYGDQFASEIIRDWSQKLFSQNTSCDKYIGSCDFYLCQEQKNPCGLDGYNLNFGFKYCSASRFTLLDQMQTDLGKSWVLNVFQCLQKKSFLAAEKIEVRSCEQIKSQAFDSHPDCYAQAGFCELKASEKLKIFELIKKEVPSIATIQQGHRLLQKCHLKNQESRNNELNTKDSI